MRDARWACRAAVPAARRIISSETSTPWISSKWRLIGRIRRPGPQPISSAASRAAHAFQLELQGLDDIGAGGEELLVVLLAAAESDVIVGIFAGALVPIGAHAFQYFGIFHRQLLF